MGGINEAINFATFDLSFVLSRIIALSMLSFENQERNPCQLSGIKRKPI